MASGSNQLQAFRQAMVAVYGEFDRIPQQDLATWKPPPQPGNAGHRGRYLWTDAFGVVNFLTLFHETAEPRYLGLAKRLVQSVHDVLGRTRDETSRLPGATDEEPLKGGLRIGKTDEYGPNADGQYHHYLTLWMFALNRLSVAAKDSTFNDLAVQLARAIHPRFIMVRNGQETMSWKISTDMTQPLVNSKGHLDDVTGLAIFQLLENTAKKFGQQNITLQKEMDQYRGMIASEGELHSSSDMLDLGMSLWISHFDRDAQWSRELSQDGLSIAQHIFLRGKPGALGRRMSYRLAFREFGACLGVKCYEDKQLIQGTHALLGSWEEVMYETTPEDLFAITLVMYAAALIPGAFYLGYFGET
ncbi:uncharacterized protein JN550_000179 [Neoarthrinium moseri]|uniref:uncharacterized protein n=1 Tax=Neoarthrinium moseri TaxID=1658444 RepID=UPI001FDE4C8B|nr:uncharacterized protein JN550_000179 [Neoarthrinium moseri]KAI1877997.1 hypothetical protein JN550_000179 [Neoarthrinium moseri]